MLDTEFGDARRAGEGRSQDYSHKSSCHVEWGLARVMLKSRMRRMLEAVCSVGTTTDQYDVLSVRKWESFRRSESSKETTDMK